MPTDKDDEVILTEAQINDINIKHTQSDTDILSFKVSLALNDHAKDLVQLSDMGREGPGKITIRLFKPQIDMSLDD